MMPARGILCLLLASVACGYPALPVSGRDSGALEQGTPSPFTFVPSHLQSTMLPATVVDLAIHTDLTIDTSALTIGGAASSAFVQQGGYAVLYGNIVTLDAHITITGALPLIIAAADQLHVSGNLDLAAVGSKPGPGAVGLGAGGIGMVQTIGQGPTHNASGGGGGSDATSGGPGGTADDVNDVAGPAGKVYAGESPSTPLIGGSPGGAGGGIEGGAGGGGGGAIELSSQVEVTIGDVAINAGGGGGMGGGNDQPGGGGGGGAGGEIVIEAPTITLAGFIAANGGGGGGGGGNDSGTSATPGAAGHDATANLIAATGGARGVPDGAIGGAGDNNATGGGSGGDDQHAGGGGGGAGVIWLRYRASSPPDVANAHFSPPVRNDSTLQ